MTVYVDDMAAEHLVRGRKMVFSHMIADTGEELEAMADRIGVRRKWIQYAGTPKEHYDIVQTKKKLAIAAGAIPITLRQCAAMSFRRRITGALGKPQDAEQWLRDFRTTTTTGENTVTTKETIAAELNRSCYPFSVPKDIAARAKAAGLLIIYGASDDLMEFDGAFRDEIGAWKGATANLDKNGVLDREQCESDQDIADFTIRKRTSRTIEAKWHDDGPYSWTYETDIPHATFAIYDDGDNYCLGIVIDTADLPEAPKGAK